MPRLRARLVRWGRFLTVYIPDDYLSCLVGVAMAWHPGVPAAFWARAVLMLVGAAALSLFIHGSDNLVGYHHGVDRLAQASKGTVKEPKLLVTGEIGPGEARALTLLCGAVVVAVAAYFVLTSHWLASVVMLTVLVLTSQYSAGLGLSYRGLGEFEVFVSGFGCAVTYLVLTGTPHGSPFVVSAILGLFFAAVNVNSNHADHPFDSAAGRGTLAVRIGTDANRRVAVGLVALAWVALVVGLATRAVPAFAAATLLLLYRHIAQLRQLWSGNPLEARRLGFATLRLIFVIFSVSFVLENLRHEGSH